MGKKKGVIALLLAVLPIVVSFFVVAIMKFSSAEVIIQFVLAIVAFVGFIFGIMALKSSKGLGITAIVLGLINAFFIAFLALGIYGLSYLIKNDKCVKISTETYSCDFYGEKMDVDAFLIER